MNTHQNRLFFLAKAPLALVLAMGLFVAACGDGEADPAPQDTTPGETGGSATPASSDADSSGAALGEMAMGPADAPVTIIEYASMTCSHCAAFHKTTVKRLKENFVDTDRIRFVFRDFPLDQFAMEAAILARCAGEDKYFDVASTLLETQEDWAFTGGPPAIRRGLQKVADEYGVSEEQYDACLTDETLQARIRARMNEGQRRFGVNSTPTIIIDGEKWEGSRAYTAIAKHLAEILPPRQ